MVEKISNGYRTNDRNEVKTLKCKKCGRIFIEAELRKYAANSKSLVIVCGYWPDCNGMGINIDLITQ